MNDKNFTIYKSSAGSGKTFTLVKEYLALALNDSSNPPQAYRHILAVTFTNKAAAEMKERIVKALKELAEEDYTSISFGTKTLLAALKEHTKLNAIEQLTDEIIRERSQHILTAILHNYSDFAIGTIDSFVHKVVKTFAFDLKIPMSFEIEMDDDKLLTQAIDLLINQIGTDEQLTKALIGFTESKTDDEKSWHIEHDLKLFAKNLLNEEGVLYVDKLKSLTIDDFFAIKDTLTSEIKKVESSIVGVAKKALDLIQKVGLTNKDFYQGDRGIAAYFQKMANAKLEDISPNSNVQKTVGEDKWVGGSASSEAKAGIESIKSNLLDCFSEIQNIKEKHYPDYLLFQLINKNIYSLAVLNEIEKLLNEYKAQNNVLHISEFNKMISKIVLTQPIPFIYERLGERYNNYLIDEFQDTSVLQFQNLLPLIDNALANGNFTMLVGDGKQAIYRWRGGEVEQFAMLPNVFKHNNNPLVVEREGALIRNYHPQVLDKNYRSKKEVVEFNNSVFKILSQKLNTKYQSIYKDLEQGFNPDNSGGFVQVEFIQEEKEAFRNQNKIKTLSIIKDLLINGYQLKDVAILVRKNTDGSDIANYLTENGIPVISSDSLLLGNSSEVNFLHSILKYLTNTGSNIVHTEILEYLVANNYMRGVTLDDLLLKKNKIGIVNLLKEYDIAFNVTQFSKMPLYELCEELIGLFKLNAQPNAYVQFFLDEVLIYSIKKNNNINDFIDYWEDKKLKASLVIPQGMNAVNIMTIHRSKGLEFPIVILPYSNGKNSDGKKQLWIDVENDKLPTLPAAIVSTSKQLQETEYAPLYEEEKNKSLLDNLNVMYVALTRAEKAMYILTGKPSKTPDAFNTMSDMFAYYYQTIGEWEEGKNTYQSGNLKPQKSTTTNSELPTSNYQLTTVNSNQWRNHIKMRAAAPSIWNTQAIDTKKDYGNMVHTALANIKTVNDLDASVNSMLFQGLINEEEKLHLQQTISKILSLPLLNSYFAEGLTVKNEMEIVSIAGELFRPDRVVLSGKNAVVIDYKTGEEKVAHKKQVNVYADLLTQMGYVVTQKLLVYVEKEKVVVV